MAKTIPFPVSKKEGYQLKITLKHIKPPVWRRFTVNSDILLPDLHKIIQTVMGWTNSHLHHFIANDRYYSEPGEFESPNSIDYGRVKFNDLITSVKQKFEYEYDFGDGWAHEILLEKILNDYDSAHPVCLAGKRSCPPEDCGGPFGYEDLLKIISDPEHEQHKEFLEWLGGEVYDPEYLDIEEINEMLMDEDYGCIIY